MTVFSQFKYDMSMNYDDTKAAALALEPKEQDMLLKELAAEHVKRKASELAQGERGWKLWLWRAVAAAAGVCAAMLCSSCSGTATAGADGSRSLNWSIGVNAPVVQYASK